MRQDEDPFAPPAEVAVRELDRVAHRIETAWGTAERLCLAAGQDLAAKFNQQLERLNAALAAGNEAGISAAAGGMRRAWIALDAAARGTGQLPPGEAVFVGMHPDGFAVALYQPGASLPDLPEGAVRVHVDTAIQHLPAIVLETFKVFGSPGPEGHRVRELPSDDIPF